jgi:hypothetical protein
MAFVFSMEETILPSLSLVLVLVPVPPLIVPFAIVLPLGPIVLIGLHSLLPLLAIPWLFYVEDLLI